ncbi:MAG: folate family ECF transporter S component [Clostridia bacterium]|nr:folate family ECF transporter S component [Clostridia bacterium]
MSKTKKLILAGLLLSILIIFDRFVSIKTLYLQISFSFLPIAIAGILLGPKYSCAIATLGDLIGSLLWPFGEYFIGFTLVDTVVGLILGLCLYNKNEGEFFEGKQLLIRLCIACALTLWIVELPIMSLMLSLLYGNAFIVVLTGRLATKLIMFPIEIAIIYFLSKYIKTLSQKFLFEQ